jgi:hypothetical protein
MASITSSSPSNSETEVYIGNTISFTISAARAIDPATINASTFVLYDQDYNIISGTYSFDAATNTATFTPTNPLLTRHEYICTILGGTAGVRSIPDAWGDPDLLASNYQFTFITNDGRFYTPPEEAEPSGVPSGIIYPAGVDYWTTYAVRSTNPADNTYNVDPSGINVDVSGIPTIIICFNKPVDLATLSAISSCDSEPASILSKDVLEDPFAPVTDLTTSGTWTSVLWQAMFTFNSPSVFDVNREITVTIPTTVRATDGTYMGAEYEFSFLTEMDPYYVGVNHVRLTPVGPLITDVPDDTIARIIHSNSILALWYSAERPSVIQPWTSTRYTGQEITLSRVAFTVDPVTGPPEYVKRFVLAKTWYDLLRAKYLGYTDSIMLGGGPGASKSLDDLKISTGSGDIYKSTVGPILERLEGNPQKGIKGEVQEWLDYITGRAKWIPGLKVQWGLNDQTKPPKRAGFIAGTTTETGNTGSNPNA